MHVPLTVRIAVVDGKPTEPVEKTIERMKAATLEQLRADGERRAVHFDVVTIHTALLGATGGFRTTEPDVIPQWQRSGDRQVRPVVKPRPEPPPADPDQPPKYFYTQISPHEISEGRYAIERGLVVITDMNGERVGSAVLDGGNVLAIARKLLREVRANSFWNHPSLH